MSWEMVPLFVLSLGIFYVGFYGWLCLFLFCRLLWNRSVIKFLNRLIWFKISRSVLLLQCPMINHAAHTCLFYCLVGVCSNVSLLNKFFSFFI